MDFLPQSPPIPVTVVTSYWDEPNGTVIDTDTDEGLIVAWQIKTAPGYLTEEGDLIPVFWQSGLNHACPIEDVKTVSFVITAHPNFGLPLPTHKG